MLKKISPNLFSAFVVGISSGLVYAFLVISSTTYMKEYGLSLTMIGVFSIKMLPYSCKYLFAPYVDHHRIRLFNRNFCLRKSWMLSTQMLLVFSIAIFGFVDIEQHIYISFMVLTVVALLGALYDVAVQAYIIELFGKENLSVGNTILICGFRFGMFFAASVGLVLATFMRWQSVFLCTALGIIPCMVFVYYIPSVKIINKETESITYQRWILKYFIEPLRYFWNQKNFWMITMIITFYKVSDAYLDAMLIPFFLERGFSKEEIAFAAKTVGIVGAVIGTILGGGLLTRWHIATVLLCAEILAAVTNLQFIIFMYIEKNYCILAAANFLESLSYGISNVALMTFIGQLCNRKFVATNFSLLSSISAFGRVVLSPTSGFVAEKLGWNIFFIISAFLSLPSLIYITLYFNKKKL